MLSDCELSSETESEIYEMENASETTRLVSNDAKEDRPSATSTKANSPGKSQTSGDGMSKDGQSSGSVFAERPSGFDVIQHQMPGSSLNINSEQPHNHSTGSSDGNGSDEHRPPSSTEHQTTLYVVLLSAFSAIGGFLFGYDTGVVSGAMLLLKDEFSLSSVDQEVVVSVTIGGASVAALLGGYLSDRFGRKVCTLFASFVFTVGALILGVAQNLCMLIVGRLTLGIGIGMIFFALICIH
jgi:SP family myo-inositol transporter-like MFS transporter 13